LTANGTAGDVSTSRIEADPTVTPDDLAADTLPDKDDAKTLPTGKAVLQYKLFVVSGAERIEFATLDVGPAIAFSGSSITVEKAAEAVSGQSSASASYSNLVGFTLTGDSADDTTFLGKVEKMNADGTDAQKKTVSAIRKLASVKGLYSGGSVLESYAVDSEKPKVKSGVVRFPTGGKVAVSGSFETDVRLSGTVTFGKSQAVVKE
jgi:hypothetical protein